MLQAKHLSYFFRNGKYFVHFLDPESSLLQTLAEQLIDCFSHASALHLPLAELEQSISCIRKAYDAKTVDALVKLLLDRSETAPASEQDYPLLRQQVFENAFALLNDSSMDLAAFREKMNVEPDIYGDLPGNEKMISFRSLPPRELLNRCNLALAQGMLFFASELEIKVQENDPGELRKMMKYLKFFRLLAEAERGRDERFLTLKISGPYSLFETPRKYALNLACFFPAVVNISKWQLSAKLNIKGREGIFELTEKKKLVSHYRNFSAYVPEEIKMFHRHFAENVTDWEITGDTPFFSAGGQKLIFPDLSFKHKKSGKIIHLELFHRWHAAQLNERLELLEQQPDIPLLIGIDRSISSKNETSQKNKIFLFRDFPGVEKTLSFLNQHK